MSTLEQLVPLDIAAEHYAAAMTRGATEGKHSEYLRILELLKKNGHYDAVLTLKKNETKAPIWASQKKA